MRLIIHKIPIIQVKNGTPSLSNECINYCIIIDKGVELSNYNYKLALPGTTILLNDYKKVLENDFKINDSPVKDYEIMTIDKGLIRELSSIKFQNKNVSYGYLDNHDLMNELLIKTPYFYDKDSINEGLFLLRLREGVKHYEDVSPHNLIDDAMRVKNSLEVIKPLSEFKSHPLFLSLNGGLKAYGSSEDLEFIKKHLLIKHYERSAQFNFNNYGEQGLYSLGELALLTNELVKIWM